MFLDDISIGEIAETVYRNKKDATLWDVIVAVFSKKGKVDSFVIWILSDYPVLELTARGHSAQYIAEFLETSLREVLTTCKVWGMIPQRETLDFDPMETYKEGQTPEEYRAAMKPVLSRLPSYEAFEDIIINVDRFKRVEEILDEWGG